MTGVDHPETTIVVTDPSFFRVGALFKGGAVVLAVVNAVYLVLSNGISAEALGAVVTELVLMAVLYVLGVAAQTAYTRTVGLAAPTAHVSKGFWLRFRHYLYPWVF